MMSEYCQKLIQLRRCGTSTLQVISFYSDASGASHGTHDFNATLEATYMTRKLSGLQPRLPPLFFVQHQAATAELRWPS